MSFYHNSLVQSLQEKIAFFNQANLSKEAELLQARLKAIESKPAEIHAVSSPPQEHAQNPIVEIARENLKAKLNAETRRIPELEKQFILENINKKTLKELEPLRIAYIERLLKISRAASGEKISFNNIEASAGPYNNEKTLSEALKLIYSQDPLWIEDLKELYFSIMPLSSAAGR
ncbi:MAG: hypothetical protein LBC85_01990 [Fibromonadaceae bacterium]|jgi:hypothetical protein|nr:hypothetical protein [Fibromonadaceae bacterium]